jgi:hypothetical protein
MPDEKTEVAAAREPLGFTDHTRSLAGEYAHEQGWGLNEEERTKLPDEKQDFEGGIDYEYGARDFGDTAVDTSAVKPSPESMKFVQESEKKEID